MGQVHSAGLWHRSVHVWLTDSSVKRVVLQQRSRAKDTHPGQKVHCGGGTRRVGGGTGGGGTGGGGTGAAVAAAAAAVAAAAAAAAAAVAAAAAAVDAAAAESGAAEHPAGPCAQGPCLGAERSAEPHSPMHGAM